MTREEIREGISRRLFQIENNFEVTDEWWAEMCENEWSNAIVCSENADKILNYLHSQGVVIKVDKELPKPLTASYIDWDNGNIVTEVVWDTARALNRAGYLAVEPLI